MYTHYLIAPSPWLGEGGLRYRRHKLTEYLLRLPTTQEVKWIYCIRDETVQDIAEQVLPNGIHEYGVPSAVSRNPDVLRTLLSPDELDQTKHTLWFTFPEFSELLELQAWNRVAYDCSDLWNKSWTTDEQSGGIPDEMAIFKKADVLFASSDYLASYIEKVAGRSAVVIESTVEFDAFHLDAPTEAGDLAHIPHPRLGFVGGMKAKVDFGLLCQVAERRPDFQIVLIGPAPFGVPDELQKLWRYPNVHTLGGRSHAELPPLVNGLDVGLLPYKSMEYNKAVFPAKFFEYLAADLPMVGSGLPSTQRYVEQGVYALTSGEVDDFIKSCEQALMWKQDTVMRAVRLQLAKQHDQATKLQEWVDHVLV